MIDFGVRYWNPAQKENNIPELKKKYSNRIAICGGWDATLTEDSNEEEAREAVRSHLDRFAKGGGYVFFGMVGSGCNLFATPTEKQMRVNGWIADELYEYGSKFYRDPKNR
jgi:uroporphyrinogen-III decarboxylase